MQNDNWNGYIDKKDFYEMLSTSQPVRKCSVSITQSGIWTSLTYFPAPYTTSPSLRTTERPRFRVQHDVTDSL